MILQFFLFKNKNELDFLPPLWEKFLRNKVIFLTVPVTSLRKKKRFRWIIHVSYMTFNFQQQFLLKKHDLEVNYK